MPIPAAPEVGHRAILATLAHLGLTDQSDPAPGRPSNAEPVRSGRPARSRRCVHRKRGRASIRSGAGQTIGTRRDGTVLSAPFDGFVVFPNPLAEVGHEWFYLAAPSTRLSGRER
jgi:hypothetical protein